MSRLPLLLQKPREALQEFIMQCGRIEKINTYLVRDVALKTITYLNANKRSRIPLELGQLLERRWYDSISKGQPDLSVYDTDFYLAALWACWIVYSRQYLLSLEKEWHESGFPLGVERIADLGCGFGYTTRALAQMFPGASVTGTNIDGTVQMCLAKKIGDKWGFKMARSINDLESPVEIIFASEYFEHIPSPIRHLREIVDALHPHILIIANSFGTRDIGHFDLYDVDGDRIVGKEVSKIFNATLRRYGYIKRDLGFWNNRPSYWSLDEQ